MRKWVVLFVCILCIVPMDILAEPAFNPEIEAAIELLSEKNTFETETGEMTLEPFTVRAVYRVELPEDTSEINEIILENYAPYERMYLIEISQSYAEIGPILTSRFYCVGLSEGDTYEFCSTPQQIAARIFDYRAFDTLIITPLAIYEE